MRRRVKNLLNKLFIVSSVDQLTFFRAVVPSLRVVAGEHSLSEDSGLEQYRKVDSFSMHPRYNPGTFEDDISLIFVRAIDHHLHSNRLNF